MLLFCFLKVPGFISRTGSKSAALVEQNNLVFFMTLYDCKETLLVLQAHVVYTSFPAIFSGQSSILW